MILKAIGKPEGCKLIRITCALSEPIGIDSLVESISIRGDFFAIPEEAFEAIEKRLCGAKVRELAAKFDELSKTLRLKTVGIDGEGIQAVVEGALNAV